jgi:hypothetical protein
MRSRCMRIVYLLLGVALLAAVGCVTGESTHYRRHLAIVRPSEPDRGVAVAFGLGDQGGATSVATADLNQP